MKNKRIKQLCAIFILSCTALYLQAQSLTGKVIDVSSSEPLSFANIVILNKSDSLYVTGTVTDEAGIFNIDIPHDNCLLKVSYMGFKTHITDATKESSKTIYLVPEETTLSEVTVQSQRKTFYMENGGISADIQNSRLKDMGNLSEVLGQLPFVLKNDNSYTVLGKGSPIFYINNRLVRDNNELQQINSSDIKKVTIITDPGVEYDASVNAVIKIETIRPVGEGFSGNIFTYNRYNKKFSTWERLSLNYRQSKLDIFADFQYLNMSFPKERRNTETIKSADGERSIKLYSDQNDILAIAAPQIGFNYQFNDNFALGARYEYKNTYKSDGDGENDIDVIKDNVLEEQLKSRYQTKVKSNAQHYINAYVNGKLSGWLTAKLDLDMVTNDNHKDTHSENIAEDLSRQNVISYEKTDSELYAGKLTLNTPLWSGNLVYGAESSYTENKQNFQVTENSGIPGIVPNKNKATQSLVAGFVSFGRNYGKLYADVGIRYENVKFKYYLNDEYIDEQSKNFSKVFPNIRLSYKNDDIQMQLAYRYTVSRPAYNELRSTIIYLAPYSYASGNPLLQPTYHNSISYTLMWKNFTFMSVYSNYKDLITELPEIYMDNSILTRFVNLDKKQLTLSANYSQTINAWRPVLDVSMTKDFIEYGKSNTTYNKPVLSTNFRNNFQVKDWQFGVDFVFRSGGNRDMEYLRTSWTTAIYLNKSFLKEKLSFNLRASDIFNTTKDIYEYKFDNLRTYYDYSMYRRNVSVQLVYRFNSTKNRYKGGRATDEIDRL